MLRICITEKRESLGVRSFSQSFLSLRNILYPNCISFSDLKIIRDLWSTDFSQDAKHLGWKEMFLHSLYSTALLVVGIDLFWKLEVLANFPIRSSCNCHISAVFSNFSVCSALTWLLPHPPWEPGITLLGCGGDHLHQEEPTLATQHLVNLPTLSSSISPSYWFQLHSWTTSG